MSTTSMSDKFFILCSSIKYIFPLLLSSVLMTSGSALAQGSPSSDTEELSRSTLTTPPEAVIFMTVSIPNSKVAQAENKSVDKTEQILVPLNGTKRINLELVNCRWWGADRFLASLLLPKSAVKENWELEFDNRESEQQVKVLNAAVIGRGKQTGYPLTPVHISVDKKETSHHEKGSLAKSAKSLQETDVNPSDANQNSKIVLPANQIVSLPLKIDLSTIPPDEYAGTIFLTLVGSQKKMDLPLYMSVRTGPFIPLGVLVIGIGLGWLSKYMKEQGEPLVKAIQEINRLKLDIIEAPLNKENQEKLLDKIDKARNFADRQDFDTVDKMIKDIRSMKEESEEPKTSTATDKNVEKVKNSIGQLVSNRINEIRKFLWRSPDRVLSEATFWLAKPILFLSLLIALSAVGLNSLYIDKKTFGSQPLPDYLGLLLWGLSTNVASLSLTDLPGAMAKKQ